MSTPTLNPGRVHQALTSYQLAQALKGAIDLELFAHIAKGYGTAGEIATQCEGTEKGVRILCDYLTVHGFLTKSGHTYGLAQDTGPLLDKNSPRYMGQAAEYFLHPFMVAKYKDVAALVRNGGAVDHTLSPNEQIWVEFARSMAPMTELPASLVARIVASNAAPARVLDVAAGHGLYGIHVALQSSATQVTFQDWDNVLDVARENVEKAGLGKRSSFLPGSFFEVDLGAGYDLALLPNFLHHFDWSTNVGLLAKVRRALVKGGRVAVVEFIPNEDRVSPPDGALFAMRMLGTTPAGDAYTLGEIDGMLREAGYGPAEARSLAPAHQQLVLASCPG